MYSYLGNSDPTYVRCKFGGYPEPYVTMRFNEKLMSNASYVAEKKLFTNALKHFGAYKCHAKNKFGSTNYSIELKLAGERSSIFELFFVKKYLLVGVLDMVWTGGSVDQ